jgi:hypothetical protein
VNGEWWSVIRMGAGRSINKALAGSDIRTSQRFIDS